MASQSPHRPRQITKQIDTGMQTKKKEEEKENLNSKDTSRCGVTSVAGPAGGGGLVIILCVIGRIAGGCAGVAPEDEDGVP